MKQLRKATIESINQTCQLLKALVEHESGPTVYKDAGLGRHVRHIVDHFIVFRDGLARDLID